MREVLQGFVCVKGIAYLVYIKNTKSRACNKDQRLGGKSEIISHY